MIDCRAGSIGIAFAPVQQFALSNVTRAARRSDLLRNGMAKSWSSSVSGMCEEAEQHWTELVCQLRLLTPEHWVSTLDRCVKATVMCSERFLFQSGSTVRLGERLLFVKCIDVGRLDNTTVQTDRHRSDGELGVDFGPLHELFVYAALHITAEKSNDYRLPVAKLAGILRVAEYDQCHRFIMLFEPHEADFRAESLVALGGLRNCDIEELLEQTVASLGHLQHQCRFVHGALHAECITLVKPPKSNMLLTLRYGVDKTFDVIDPSYIVRFADLARSSIRLAANVIPTHSMTATADASWKSGDHATPKTYVFTPKRRLDDPTTVLAKSLIGDALFPILVGAGTLLTENMAFDLMFMHRSLIRREDFSLNRCAFLRELAAEEVNNNVDFVLYRANFV